MFAMGDEMYDGDDRSLDDFAIEIVWDYNNCRAWYRRGTLAEVITFYGDCCITYGTPTSFYLRTGDFYD